MVAIGRQPYQSNRHNGRLFPYALLDATTGFRFALGGLCPCFLWHWDDCRAVYGWLVDGQNRVSAGSNVVIGVDRSGVY